MDFSTLQSECFAQLGMDSSDSTNVTLVKRWINIVQQDIAGRWPWNFLRNREVIQTIPDYTTGTCSVTSAGTTVTGASTVWTATMVGYYIQFQGTNDWYKITARASNTSITIEVGYAPTTSLAAGSTYIIRKFFYSLSSTADRIVDIRNWNTPLKLIETDPLTLDSRRPNPQSTATSSAFIAYGYDASGNLQISPYPYPNDSRNLEIRTIVRLSDLSASGDLSLIPVKWHHVIIFGALSLGFMYLRKPEMSASWNAEYEKKIVDMKKQQRTSLDDESALKAIDSVARGNFVRLPDQYPSIGPGGA